MLHLVSRTLLSIVKKQANYVNFVAYKPLANRPIFNGPVEKKLSFDYVKDMRLIVQNDGFGILCREIYYNLEVDILDVYDYPEEDQPSDQCKAEDSGNGADVSQKMSKLKDNLEVFKTI